jgi:DNA-binding NarL/FixJ family response regulator
VDRPAPARARAGARLPRTGPLVLVADGEPVYRAGAVAILAAGGLPAEPVDAVDLAELSETVLARRAAGVLLDASLGLAPYAVDVVDELIAVAAGLGITVIVDRAGATGLVHVLERGARAVVHRGCSPDELVAAVSAAVRGQNWVAAPLAGALRAELLAEASGEHPAPLTPRERDILRGLAHGGSNADIARRLGISEHTVRNHVHSLLRKLGVANRTDAVATGLRRGLLEITG